MPGSKGHGMNGLKEELYQTFWNEVGNHLFNTIFYFFPVSLPKAEGGLMLFLSPNVTPPIVLLSLGQFFFYVVSYIKLFPNSLQNALKLPFKNF